MKDLADYLSGIRSQLRTAAEHRLAADELRREAVRLEKTAAAIEHIGRPLGNGVKRGRHQGNHITIKSVEREGTGTIRTTITIGKALWYPLRETITAPAIQHLQRLAVHWNRVGDIWFEPCGWGDGYAVQIATGAPRFFVGPTIREILPPDGRYRGLIQEGRLYLIAKCKDMDHVVRSAA